MLVLNDFSMDHQFGESKVLGSSLTCYKCYLNIFIMPIESFPHSCDQKVGHETIPLPLPCGLFSSGEE